MRHVAQSDNTALPNYPMKIWPVVVGISFSANLVVAEVAHSTPQPRLKLDPVTRAAVAEDAAKAVDAAAQKARAGNAAREPGDASPILLGKYVVRERGTGAREAPKQEMFEGRFSPLKGGRILGGKRYDLGFWPALEFTKVAGTAMREGGPRLNVDLLRVKW